MRQAAVNHLQTQRWEQGLADLQHPVPSDSLIPMFEGMVERAFSRSSNLELRKIISRLDRPVNPTQSQLRGGRFQDPSDSLARPKNAPSLKTLSRGFFAPSVTPLPKPDTDAIPFKPLP